MKKRVAFINAATGCSETINSQDFLDYSRKRPEDFTRKRKMPFVKLVVFMINTCKFAIQCKLDLFFENLGVEQIHMSQQSFSEARKKIRWESFQYLFKSNVDFIYTGYYETWHGFRVSAIDGSKIQIPDDPKLKVYFGTMGSNNTANTAQASALYDVFNNVLMDAQLEPLTIGERELAIRHIESLRSLSSFRRECVLFDRGYASFALIELLKLNNVSFVMRVKRGFNNDIDRLGKGDHKVCLKKDGHDDISVRVIKFTLSSGEEEILVTDIVDKRMGVQAFKKLYFKRWPILYASFCFAHLFFTRLWYCG